MGNHGNHGKHGKHGIRGKHGSGGWVTTGYAENTEIREV
jgi:hypothetical protein